MPLLKDYLGSLVSGINQARAMADVESAKIAQVYASDTILRNFSIPRFKASSIELDIPIAIDKLEEIEERNYQPIDNRTFNSEVYTIFKDVLKVDSLGRKNSDLLRKKIAFDTDVLEKELKAKENRQESIQKYSVGLMRYFIENIGKTKIVVTHLNTDKDIEKKLLKALQEGLVSKIREPQKTIDMDNTKVLVESHQLKEIPTESIVRIKMTLVEEGMEWHTIEKENGEVEHKLLPE